MRDEEISKEEREISVRHAFSGLTPFLLEHKKGLIVCLSLLIGITVLSLAWPWLIREAIDGPIASELQKEGDQRGFNSILWIGLGIVIIQILTLFLQYWQRVKLETIGQDIMLALKTKIFDHMLSLDISFFDTNPVGRLMARVESDAESLRMLFTNTVVLVVGDIVLMAGIYGIMFYTNWKIALILGAFVPLLAVLIYIFHRFTTHRFLEVRKRMAEVTASLAEFLHGMSIVQIFHRGDYARKRVFHYNERKFSEDAYVNITVCIFFNILFYFEWVKIGLVLWLGAIWGRDGRYDRYVHPAHLEGVRPDRANGRPTRCPAEGDRRRRRIFALLNVRPRVIDPAHPTPWPGFTRSIRFENVWFSYNDDGNWVLRDVSFEIPVGKRIALAGVTGGGKSTVISLLLRMYDPQRGRITIDGIDLRDMNIADVRRRFALVLQDIILFPGDVAANIGLESDAVDRERIVDAARTVAADDFIDRLPKAYETEISEKGANFSRGERQLLSFARALAVDPEVLILRRGDQLS